MTERRIAAELRSYLDADWDLIPLHRYDAKGVGGRPLGKAPLHKGWTDRNYNARETAARTVDGSGNCGARPRADQLVIDVDPRRFLGWDTLDDPGNPLDRLCADFGLDPVLCPTVRTGSGGLHLYMTRPADGARSLDTLPDYPGLEFKGKGRQVVAAGSTHPNGSAYRWMQDRPPLIAAPAAPDRLLAALRAPEAGGAHGGGEHTPEELAEMLSRLDPCEFRDELRWRELMMACHHATGGEGREEFLEWCAGDPEYADDRGRVGPRWDSLTAHREEGAVTTRTLRMELVRAGAGDVAAVGGAEDDFDTAIPPIIAEEPTPLEKLNKEYCCVMDDGRHVVMWQQPDPEMGRTKWTRAKTQDFKAMLKGRRLERDDGKTEELSDAWLRWPGRRRADYGVIFDPEGRYRGFLNLWTGWGVEPKSGSWEYLRRLLREGLCAGDDTVYQYVMNWCAHMTQRPARPAEVALVFRGGKGTGKSTFGDALARIAGRHGMTTSSSDLLTGRFNDHLRDALVLVSDEAASPYDRGGEARLKGLITQHMITYEGKGRDAVQGRNMLHMVLLSNDGWVVPASLKDERRFMVQDVNPKFVGNRAFFDALHVELENGGLSALLQELMTRDVSGFEPRANVPQTTALGRQKERSMDVVHKWWMNALREGELPFSTFGEWWMEPVRALASDINESFSDFCRGIKANPGSGAIGVGRRVKDGLKEVLPYFDKVLIKVPDDRPDVPTRCDGRAYGRIIPSLDECRGYMERAMGCPIDWDDD